MQEIKKISIDAIPVVQGLSREIWNKVYPSIISQEQIDYMLEMMYSKESLEKQMTEMDHHFFLLYSEGMPVGFASYSIKSNQEPHTVRLNKLYLQPECHGMGFGKAMIDYVVKQSTILNASNIELNVNKQNPAVRFYKRQGFSIKSEMVLDIGNGYVMDDYIMTMPL